MQGVDIGLQFATLKKYFYLNNFKLINVAKIKRSRNISLFFISLFFISLFYALPRFTYY